MAGDTLGRTNDMQPTSTSAQTHAQSDLDARTPGAGRVVLIVDDDPDFLLQHSTILKSLGFEVVTAAARGQAEELLVSTRWPWPSST